MQHILMNRTAKFKAHISRNSFSLLARHMFEITHTVHIFSLNLFITEFKLRGFNQLLIDVWLLVSEVSTLNLILLTTQNMVTTGILPPQGKIPMVEPGIEPGTS